jgi:hypothetical protein
MLALGQGALALDRHASAGPALLALDRGTLALDRHAGGRLTVRGIVLAPQRGDGLGLGVEVEALLPVEVGVPEEGAAGPREGHHGQRHGDRHVHSHLRQEDKCSVAQN